MSPDNPALAPGYFAKASLGLVELQARENRIVTALTLSVAFAALAVSIYGIVLSKQQLTHAEIQSGPDRVNKIKAIRTALDFCKDFPPEQESTLYDLSTGRHMPCGTVLRLYKNSSEQ